MSYSSNLYLVTVCDLITMVTWLLGSSHRTGLTVYILQSIHFI